MRAVVQRVSRASVSVDGSVVGRFTLYGDARKGRRPTWHRAAPAARSR